MGAWGLGPFSNDEAADLLGELAELGSGQQQDVLTQALQLPPPGTYLESPEASTAVAAAALVAMRQGYSPPADEAHLVPSLQFEANPRLRAAASAALGRVQASDSEWAELWEDAGESDDVARVLTEIDRYLA